MSNTMQELSDLLRMAVETQDKITVLKEQMVHLVERVSLNQVYLDSLKAEIGAKAKEYGDLK